jgi:hypothetical protein
METCSFTDFMKVLEPWLNRDFVRKAFLDAGGYFRLAFVDGGERLYRLDGCTEGQLKDVLRRLAEKGVPVEKVTGEGCR